MSRWYWAISCDNSVDDPLVVDRADLAIDPQLLTIGEYVEATSHLGRLSVSKASNDGMPDDVLQNYLGLPVYSARLRKALELAGVVGIQFLSVEVVSFSGQGIDGYSVANIVERRRALDFARTDYELFPVDHFVESLRGKVRALRNATLKGDQLKSCDVVRLFEFASSVYVSQRFKDAFEPCGCTGYSFREVSVSEAPS